MNLILSALLLFIFSRGVFEILISKTVGYVVGLLSLLAISLSALVLTYAKRRSIHIPVNSSTLSFMIYLLFVFISIFVSVMQDSPATAVGVLYSLLHVFFLGSLIVLTSNPVISFRDVEAGILCCGYFVVFCGFLDLFNIVSFPGDHTFQGFARISGSLGSKQHFSFACASLGMLSLWLYLRNRKSFSLILSVLLIALTFISLSRNGMPIVVGTLVLHFLQDPMLYLRRLWRQIILVVLAFVGCIAWLSRTMDNIDNIILSRFISIFFLDSAGNSGRVQAWIKGFQEFSSGPILYGNNVGQYSQAGTRLGILSTNHFESALIQQFANFGIIAGFAFVVFFAFYCLRLRDHYLKSLAVMTSLTYLYYPGSESIPFIGAWFLLALAEASTYSQGRRARLAQLSQKLLIESPS